jgi:hypothetical protein
MVCNPLACVADRPRQTHGVLARVKRDDAARERDVVRSMIMKGRGVCLCVLCVDGWMVYDSLSLT